MRVASFFSGIGGFDLGLERAGHQVVFQCEINQFCLSILSHHWPNIPVVSNILELEDGSIVPESEIWCGGFPCQDVSLARARPRDGLNGARSGLFYPFAKLVSQARPRVVLLENVPGLLTSGASLVDGSHKNRLYFLPIPKQVGAKGEEIYDRHRFYYHFILPGG